MSPARLCAPARLLPALLALLAPVVHAAAPAPAPTEHARHCNADATGGAIIRNPPSCAARIADGERRFGVRARFLSLAESRQIPGSWLYTSPWGPCAEGDSLVFLTPGGERLFAQTAGQCDEVFAGTSREAGPAPQPPAQGTPGPGPSISPPSGSSGSSGGGALSGSTNLARMRGVASSGGSGTSSVVGQRSEFGCVAPPPGARETVRGMPGGALCELRASDELYCRQRSAYSRNPYLPTNPAWDLKPVGLRVTQDCRFLAGAGAVTAPESPPARPVAAERWTRPGRCCVGADRRAVCPADQPRLLSGHARLDVLRNLDSCPAPQIDPIVRGIELPNPAGDAGQWAAGLLVGTARCLQLTLAGAQQMALHAQQWRFDLLERDLGLAREPLPRGVAPLVRPPAVVEHRMLSLMVQAMSEDVVRARLGAFADDPKARRITDFESGQRAGEHLCGYGLLSGGQKLLEPVAGLAGRVAGSAATRAGRAVASRAGPVVAEAGRRARSTIAAVRERARLRGAARLDVAETRQVTQAIEDVTRPTGPEVAATTLQDALEQRLLEVESIRRGALAHTGVTLPGQRGPVPVNLGDYRGGGSFSAVYDLLDASGRPNGRVLKLVHETRPVPRSGSTPPPRLDNLGGESVERQLRGARLLQQAGVETPPVHDWFIAERPGEISWLETDAVPTGAPTHDTWSGTRFGLADKQAAVVELHERIGASGAIAIDTSGRNLYFYRDAPTGRVRAGMWDTDFIDPVDAPIEPRYEAMRLGALNGEMMRDPAAAQQKIAAFMDIPWDDAAVTMERVRVINYGF